MTVHKQDKAPTFSTSKETIPSQGGDNWVNGADVVLQIEISDFTSDMLVHAFTLEILAWSKLDIKLMDVKTGKTSKVEIEGFGKYKALGATKGSWKSALNKSYNSVLGNVEALILSEYFYKEIQSLSTANN